VSVTKPARGSHNWDVALNAALDDLDARKLDGGSWQSGYSQVPGTGVSGTFALAAGTLYFTPLFVPKGAGITAIGCEVTVVAASSVVRLGIYADAGSKPGARVVDAGTVDTSATTGIKEIALSQTFTDGGLFWLAGACQGGGPTMRTLGTNALPGIGYSGTVLANGVNCYTQTGVTGALPPTAAPVSTNTHGLRVYVRAA
jgi:hypothetical protein